MNVTEITLAITAFGGFVATVVGALGKLRSDKSTQAETDTARTMANYSTLIDTLHKELRRVQTDFAAAREEWRKDREDWRQEREELRDEIETLRQRVRDLERGITGPTPVVD